jgi:ABC-2 type transport system permease protein
MNKIGLIIQREYLTRVRKKSFLIMSILGPFLIAGLMILVLWMGMAENESQKLLVIDDLKPAFSSIPNKSNEKITFDYVDIPLDKAKLLLLESNYTGVLHIPHNILHANTAQLFFEKQPSIMVQRHIENKVESIVEGLKLKQYKIDKDDFYNVKTNFKLNTIRFKESGEEEETSNEKAMVGFAFSLIIYLFIFMYGVQVMRGVIEEKTSRIVEVIISSVKPFELMMGKIIGVAMVGLTQFLIWTLLTFAVVNIGQSVLFDMNYSSSKLGSVQMTTEMTKELQSEANFTTKDAISPDNIIFRINWPLMLGMFLFYFLAGHLLYSALFAAVGAIVDNETDTQQFIIPISLPLILAYAMSSIIIQNPDGPAAFWFSIIPFTSPIIMVVRIAMGIGDGAIWEVLLSMALLIATFIAITWLAAKIYKAGILMYGKKPSYKEVWKWLNH